MDYLYRSFGALDMSRWQWMKGKLLHIKPEFPRNAVQAPARKGHEVHVTPEGRSFGRGQIIWRDNKTSVLQGGTELRTDGAIAAW